MQIAVGYVGKEEPETITSPRRCESVVCVVKTGYSQQCNHQRFIAERKGSIYSHNVWY